MRIANELRYGEDGFTLVELLTAMALSLIVLFATLQSLDVFSSNAAHQTRVTDANEQVRMTMDRVTRDLRGASAIVRATDTDLVYTVPETAGVRTERLCVDTDRLLTTTSTAAAVATPPAACTGNKLATLRSPTETPFTYDSVVAPANSAVVRNVGLTFSLRAVGGGRSAISTLSASAARRSAGILNLSDSEIHDTCGTGGVARLDLAVSIPGVGSQLKAVYSSDGGITFQSPVTGNAYDVPAGVTKVLARVTDGLGLTKTIAKDVKCDT